jgi:hypothetical protein
MCFVMIRLGGQSNVTVGKLMDNKFHNAARSCRIGWACDVMIALERGVDT